MPRMVVTEQERALILACREEGDLPLSPREDQMLQLIRAGMGTHKDLANALFLSEGTTKIYVHRIYEKVRATGCEVNSMAGLLAWAWARERGELETYRRMTAMPQCAATRLREAV